jgi:uncharacterized protein YbaP (TraB family)
MLRILFMVLLMACASQLRAQNKPRTILWQVHKPGTHHTSYLFGTFHEVHGPYFSSLTASAKHLSRAQLLFVERSSAESKQVEKIGRELANWNSSKWHSLLTAQQRGVFARFVEKAEDSTYYQQSPLMLRLALFRIYGQNFCDTLEVVAGGQLLDQYIEKQALAQQIPVQSLDTQADVAKALSPASDLAAEADHAAYCVDLMNKMLRNDGSECGFVQAYKRFELNYEFEQPGRNVLGLMERNANWMPILDVAFQKKNCFVAVGFQHLKYKRGLIQQLRHRGYTVTPIAAR